MSYPKTNSLKFEIKYRFIENSHETEISMYIDGINILEFERDGKLLTTRWNLDELAMWLRSFVENACIDPYPVDVEGEYAAIKDIKAREFDTDDDDEFDKYYDKLDEWNMRHRWHPASNGAILADVYFQLTGNEIEISWNNQDAEDGVKFKNVLGGAKVPKEVFIEEINKFLKDYADYWYAG